MYKVFINQKVVSFVSGSQFDWQFINNKIVLVQNNPVISKQNMLRLLDSSNENLFVLCKDLKKTWQNFTKKFKRIKAGGGLVFNSKNDLLFIYRRGKWDLPKGKLDRGETIEKCAIREVKEECGIKKITSATKLCSTFHVYSLKNQFVLKESVWYLMKMKKQSKLIPQTEEDITKLEFISRKNYAQKIKKKTYPLIADMVDHLPEFIY